MVQTATPYRRRHQPTATRDQPLGAGAMVAAGHSDDALQTWNALRSCEHRPRHCALCQNRASHCPVPTNSVAAARDLRIRPQAGAPTGLLTGY